MNFNHLMDKKQMRNVCPHRDNCKNCYWKLTGNVRACIGGNVNVSMYCKKCNISEEVFLTEKEYSTHKKIILREVSSEISTG